ncbi:MAG: hypothetical protein BGO41_08810 [Clostridiales bacterium 38-18]|nr:MAG: hypothetical protein BGO41_08810 [Clostridiales bacterium 38-18]
MAKLTAYMTGLALSIMISINGLLGTATNVFFSNVIYHGVGFILLGVLVGIAGKKAEHKVKFIYFIPGMLGSITILLNNYVMQSIGVTLMVAFTLVGQVLTSLIIDYLGLLGKPKLSITRKQLSGILVMIVGLVVMVI